MCYFHKLLPRHSCPFAMAFAMATSIEGPSDPTDNDKARIFQFVNAQLNSQILYVLLYAAISKGLAPTMLVGRVVAGHTPRR